MMGFTALVHLILDNEKNCNFDKIILDSTSFCFINDCGVEKLFGNMAQNWAEEMYAINMVWTTMFSAQIADFSLENGYRFYHSMGESSAILFTGTIGHRPTSGYEYDPDDTTWDD